MTALRLLVDDARCVRTGMCEAQAPAVVEITDDGALRVLQDPVDPAQHAAARAAVTGCPTRALSLASAQP